MVYKLKHLYQVLAIFAFEMWGKLSCDLSDWFTGSQNQFSIQVPHGEQLKYILVFWFFIGGDELDCPSTCPEDQNQFTCSKGGLITNDIFT